MSKNKSIGTSQAAIAAAEQALGRTLPAFYVQWLLLNNGRALGALSVFPVYDETNARKTWESIARHYNTSWQEWLENVDGGNDASTLLPLPSSARATITALTMRKRGRAVNRWSCCGRMKQAPPARWRPTLPPFSPCPAGRDDPRRPAQAYLTRRKVKG